jgi:transcriptional regulator with XRE-family HTH domain
MISRPQPSIGQRVAALRKLRGLTQAGLAARLHRSESWITKIERGERRVDSMAVLRELSEALGVSVSQLTGQDEGAAGEPNGRETADLIELRRIIDRPAHARAGNGRALRPVADVHRDAKFLMDRYCKARNNFSEALPGLPGLIREAQATVATDSAAERRRAYAAMAVLYRIASVELELLGKDVPRARVAMERALSSAADSDNSLLLASVATMHTLQLTKYGDAAEAVAVALDIADLVERDGKAETASGLVVVGSLKQFAMRAAARAGDRSEARSLLKVVMAGAERLGRDRGAYGTYFGVANATNTEIDTLTDLGRPRDAIRRAEGIRAEWLGNVNRMGFHYKHLARARWMRGQDDCALTAIATGLRLAPELVRLEPTFATIVRDMLRRRRVADELLRRVARDLHVDS